MEEQTIRTLAIGAIKANPDQPRQEFNKEKLEDLATSLRDKGLLQPITVRQVNSHFEIVAGERRFRAAQLAGWDTIPALVRDLTDDEAYELSVLENAVREDLNPMEEAKMLAKLLARPMTVQEVGALVGLATSQITWRVDLLNLREDVQYLIGRRQMKPGTAYYMAKLSLNSQARVLRVWQEKGLGDDGIRGLCEQIWMEENQADMMPETKLSDGARQAVAAYHRALVLAAKAAQELSGVDTGQIAEALAPEMETAMSYLDTLIKSLTGMRRALGAHNGRTLAGKLV